MDISKSTYFDLSICKPPKILNWKRGMSYAIQFFFLNESLKKCDKQASGLGQENTE